jgi:hypothetical protein
VDQIFKIDPTVTAIDSAEVELTDTASVDHTIKNAWDPFRGNRKLAGRKNIRMTEWGPYDFEYPLLWNTNPVDTTGILKFEVLGPKGSWDLISMKGVELVDDMIPDTLPAKFSVRVLPAARTDIDILLEYTGPSFTDPFGVKVPANKPYRFSYRKFFQPVDFRVQWYAFDSTTNPIAFPTIARLQQQQPFQTEHVNKLDYAWWGGIHSGDHQYTQFLTIADGSAYMEAGTYELAVTWDDAVRLYMDGKLVLDEWEPSKYSFDESPHKKVRVSVAEGQHLFRIEQVELGEFATLSFKISKL